MGCGGPALLHSSQHVIITTAVGTPLCWRLTRCHRVLPSQASYGWIGWVGVGIKYSKPFVCICKHTATRIRIWRGCPAGGRFPHGECFLALCFALPPVSYSLQSRQRPQTNPRTLDEHTHCQNWSAIYIPVWLLVHRKGDEPPACPHPLVAVHIPCCPHVSLATATATATTLYTIFL